MPFSASSTFEDYQTQKKKKKTKIFLSRKMKILIPFPKEYTVKREKIRENESPNFDK